MTPTLRVLGLMKPTPSSGAVEHTLGVLGLMKPTLRVLGLMMPTLEF